MPRTNPLCDWYLISNTTMSRYLEPRSVAYLSEAMVISIAPTKPHTRAATSTRATMTTFHQSLRPLLLQILAPGRGCYSNLPET